MTDAAMSAGGRPRRGGGIRFERYAPGILLGLAIVLYVVLLLGTGQARFLSLENAVSILNRSVALAITAVGQTFAILVASIDLSVASLISAATVLASVIMNGDPSMILPAVLAVLALGAVVGCINGVVITKLDVNPLIATLGMSLIIQGCLSAVVTNFAGRVPPEFQVFAYGQIGPLPYSLVFLAAMVLLAFFVLRFTRFGSDVYSVGGNKDAARLAGIKTDRVVIGPI